MKKVSFLVALLASSIVVTGCSSNSTAPVSENKPGTIKREGDVQLVQIGMVTHVKEVTVLGKRSSVGGTVGRTAGSIAGGAIGSGYGSVAGSVIGGALGGMFGSNADKNLQKQPGLELTVRLDDGKHVTVTQLATEPFKTGDRVKLIMKDGKAHVEALRS